MSRLWTLGELQAAQRWARNDCSRALIGAALGRQADELDEALLALVGRTPRQALARLNRRSGRTVPLRASLRRWAAWMRTVHGRRPLALTRREPAVYEGVRP
jgi:hypothetical protein